METKRDYFVKRIFIFVLCFICLRITCDIWYFSIDFCNHMDRTDSYIDKDCIQYVTLKKIVNIALLCPSGLLALTKENN